MSSLRLLALLALPAASCATLEPKTIVIDLNRPTVVAFLPTALRESSNGHAPASRNRVNAAVERTKECLGADFASYQVVSADRILVRSRGREESFEVAHGAPLVGALLLRPDGNPRLLFAGGGPEALPRMLRRAAADYFGKKCGGEDQ